MGVWEGCTVLGGWEGCTVLGGWEGCTVLGVWEGCTVLGGGEEEGWVYCSVRVGKGCLEAIGGYRVIEFWGLLESSEPVFVNLLRSLEIDSQPDGPVRQPYLTFWPARLHRLAE